jgi:hypothetical protein
VRRELTLVLCLIPALVLGQNKIHLEFQSGGPRVGWISEQLTTAPSGIQKWDGTGADLDSTGSKADSYVEVLDASSGNLAAKKVGDIPKGWLVKDSDFGLVGHVRVRVEHEGALVSFATVTANDGSTPQEQLLDPSLKGIVDFYAVKPGPLKLIVTYHTGSSTKPQKQSFDLDLKRDNPVPLLVVSIPDPVTTLASATGNSPIGGPTGAANQAGGGSNSNTPPPVRPVEPSHNALGEIFIYLLVIFFAGLVVYFGFTWMQKNQQKTQGALSKFGISLQDPLPPDASSVAFANNTIPSPPQPAPQILLSDSAPTPLASAAPVMMTHAAVSPRLVRENGSAVDLPEGSATVSRDPGQVLSVDGEGSISRRHAEVVRSGSHVVVRDLGSTNGTFVNGQKISGETALRSGDTVQFGTIRFRYEG